MDRVYRLIARRPYRVLALEAVLVLAALAVLVDLRTLEPRLRIETAVQKILPTEGREHELYQRFRERFGNDEFLFLGIVTEDVFTADDLGRIVRITRRLEAVEGIRQVVSLSSAPDVRSVDGDVSVRNVFDEVPASDEAMRALRERVLANPLHVGNLVSADGRTAAFLIYPLEMDEAEFRDRGIDHEVERIAHEEAPDAEILIAGTPPLKAVTSRILRRDLFRFVPLNYAVMALVAFLAFRSVRGTAIPLAGVGLAQLWTLAAIVLAGRSLNLITFIVPALVIAVGFAYSVHTVSEHDEAIREGRSGADAVEAALRHVSFPVLLTGLTTAAGFLSLCLSSLPAIREFGIFCVIGVLASVFAALTFVPAVLAVLPRPAPRPRGDGGRPSLDRWVHRVATAVVGRSGFVMALYLGVALAAAWGVTRIEVSTAFTSNLKRDHPLRRDIHAFDERVGGSITLHVVVETDEKDSLKRPETLAKLREIQTWIDAQPEVTQTTSLADYLMVVNQAFHDGDPEAFRIPETKRLISQFLFFLWHDRLDSLVNRSFDSADILVRIAATPSKVTADLLDRIEARLADPPEGIRAYVTGDTPMIVRTIDDIAWGQAVSLSGATAIIYLILALYFRSPRIASMALIPNALPVLVYFGVLGLSGVTLNIITSLIACIVLGIAVDDTIHFLTRFREKVRTLGDDRRAAIAALRAVARPVTSTTAALAAGFLALAVSGLRHQVEFAVLASSMLVFAWLVDVTFTPALCARMGLAGRAGGGGGGGTLTHPGPKGKNHARAGPVEGVPR